MIQERIAQGVYIKDIAEELGVHPRTVSRAIERGGSPSGRRPTAPGSKLDAYKPTVDRLLGEGVWNARVIFREIQAAGYQGGESILRAYIHPKRPLRAARATVRFETAPGHQLQNDWAKLATMVGGREQEVHFAVNTLGYRETRPTRITGTQRLGPPVSWPTMRPSPCFSTRIISWSSKRW